MPCHVPAHTALNIMPGTSLFSQQHTVASKARCTQAVLLPLPPVASHQQATGTPQGPPSHAERHTELRRHACASKRSFCSPSACVPCENRVRTGQGTAGYGGALLAAHSPFCPCPPGSPTPAAPRSARAPLATSRMHPAAQPPSPGPPFSCMVCLCARPRLRTARAAALATTPPPPPPPGTALTPTNPSRCPGCPAQRGVCKRRMHPMHGGAGVHAPAESARAMTCGGQPGTGCRGHACGGYGRCADGERGTPGSCASRTGPSPRSPRRGCPGSA